MLCTLNKWTSVVRSVDTEVVGVRVNVLSLEEIAMKLINIVVTVCSGENNSVWNDMILAHLEFLCAMHYRAKRGIVIACPSVCLSVCDIGGS